ncbi:MAG: hypothetical protein NC395_07240 [Prevotella sp.]|nr:hypothetical protein [Prevotella sp.]
MINLEDFLYKNVVVVDTDGIEHKGYVDMYCSAYENDDTEDSIGIIPDENTKYGIALYQSEIKSIELI